MVHGHKWYITEAAEAAHFILLARTSDDPRRGLSAFLFHRDDPGWEITRRIQIMGPDEHGGHCELTFDGLRIPKENLLLEEGRGLKVTQIRLGPARLTHCMRWLGLSKRCVGIAQDYAARREGFGIRLADRESVQVMLGDLAMQIEIGRLLVMKAAWEIDRGGYAPAKRCPWPRSTWPTCFTRPPIRRSRSTARAAIPGTRSWNGSTATPGRRAWSDGADEVHKMVLNRHLEDRGAQFYCWDTAE